MNMTMDQYIANPMGKSNAILNNIARESIRNTYVQKFGAILLRENGKIVYHLYYNEKDNTYWAHIKVPSEVVPKFYYDVVFKFYADASVADGGENLNKYFVKFFSNDPAFVFTYAHVFYENDLLIKELTSKMSKLALKKAPKEKNPLNAVGYVKAIYFAYLYMKDRGLFKQSRFKAESTKFNRATLLSDVEEADSKVEKRQEEENKLNRKKKSDDKHNKTTNNKSSSIDNNSPLKIKNTKSVGRVVNHNIKSTKNTKRK